MEKMEERTNCRFLNVLVDYAGKITFSVEFKFLIKKSVGILLFIGAVVLTVC
jgi:hypothetical protein